MNKNDQQQKTFPLSENLRNDRENTCRKTNRFRGAKLRGVFYRKLGRLHTVYVIHCSLAKLCADCEGRVTAAGHYSDEISTSRHCRQEKLAKKSNSPPRTLLFVWQFSHHVRLASRATNAGESVGFQAVFCAYVGILLLLCLVKEHLGHMVTAAMALVQCLDNVRKWPSKYCCLEWENLECCRRTTAVANCFLHARGI
ncbi:hypothetical protein TNIN_3321 [Trichonephila inaurata madagascariensis]|uniref:Uncharacterized protein n=1 Tax=Trichonephila inaurata madagascariensis TaxID=2747483 RepID=A0A8X6YY68_9ARAC|nr:hypothetical protein TNIN_3321 [Trichonephila inaurata madagascariensis]